MNLLAGLYLNSALYLAGCFVAGLATGNDVAWKLALVAMGLAYVGYYVQVAYPGARVPALFAVSASIIAGVASGLALLWRS